MAGTMRAAAVSVLGLVALQAVGSAGGSGRISGLFNDVSTMLDRLLDPTVPAIPDLANGEKWGGGGTATVGTPPNGVAIPVPANLDPAGAYGYSPYLVPFPVT